jgi:KaiC/GvpD/RAD55 family RecA-like ATPase
MLNRIAGAPNSGKTLYSIMRVLRRAYFEKTCVISFEQDRASIARKIDSFMKNENISNVDIQELSVKDFPTLNGLDNLVE